MVGLGFQGVPKGSTAHRRKLVLSELLKAGALQVGACCTLQWSRDGTTTGQLSLMAGPGFLAMDFDHQGKAIHQSVKVVSTVPFYGGIRYWLTCPGCARRCSVFYQTSEGLFACWRCCGLNYQSTREDKPTRGLHKAERIRAKLGWPRGVVWGHGPRPKDVQPKKFLQLVAEHDRLIGLAYPALIRSELGNLGSLT